MEFKLLRHAFYAVALLLPVVAAAETKIGYVNLTEILEKSPQADAARKTLEKEFSYRNEKLTAVRDEILKFEETLQKDGAVMTETRRSELEKEILNKKREYSRQQEELKEDFNIRRNQEIGDLQKSVNEVVNSLAKSQNYDLVVTQPVLFASDRIDMTDQVLEELRKVKQ